MIETCSKRIAFLFVRRERATDVVPMEVGFNSYWESGDISCVAVEIYQLKPTDCRCKYARGWVWVWVWGVGRLRAGGRKGGRKIDELWSRLGETGNKWS